MTMSEERYPEIDTEPGPWAIGLTVFAAAMMITTGMFQVLEGIVAVVDDNFFVRLPNYTYEVDTTAWGWIHILIGAIVALIGVSILTGAVWARVIGVVVVIFSLFSNFLFIPYYPLWAIVIITIDVAVIWALSQPTIERGRAG